MRAWFNRHKEWLEISTAPLLLMGFLIVLVSFFKLMGAELNGGEFTNEAYFNFVKTFGGLGLMITIMMILTVVGE
jgi:uncharacterized membrane protein